MPHTPTTESRYARPGASRVIRDIAATAQPLAFGDQPDLQALEAAIGDAQVVLLGEQNHGDGAAFAVKAQVIEYLNKKLGFDVLAFEADFFALQHSWDEAVRKADAGQLSRHVYYFWRDEPQVAPLWNLVQERLSSSRPLIVTGIDVRHTGAYPKSLVADELESHLARNGVDLNEDWHQFRSLLDSLLEEEYSHRVNAKERIRFMDGLWRLREQLDGNDRVSRFWRQELSNLVWTARNAWGFEGRDEGMGRNLAWLARERYPDKRIVVWSHNYHVVRSKAALDASHPPYARERAKYPDTPMGEVAARELDSSVRSIALVAGQGWTSPNAWKRDLKTHDTLTSPLPGSMESELLATNLDYAYLDLTRVTSSFTLNGIEHGTPIETTWHQAFDGLLYIREMSGLGIAGEEY